MFIGWLVFLSIPCYIFCLFKLLEEASALLKIDMDKQVIREFNMLSDKLVSMAPDSNLKTLCLQSVEESQTDTERTGKPHMLIICRSFTVILKIC